MSGKVFEDIHVILRVSAFGALLCAKAHIPSLLAGSVSALLLGCTSGALDLPCLAHVILGIDSRGGEQMIATKLT